MTMRPMRTMTSVVRRRVCGCEGWLDKKKRILAGKEEVCII